MSRALNIAATGMAAQEDQVNTISNNIANVNTTAYKKKRTEFEDLLYETVEQSGARSSATTQYAVGTQYGTGVKTAGTKRNHLQGSPLLTNAPFDVMINGEGYFGIILPNNQVRFTRDGSFSVDSQGNLVTKNGYRVFPGLSLPQGITSVNISENGNVEAFLPNQVEPQNVGQIPVFTFTNEVGLKNVGGNLYAQTVGSGNAQQMIAGQNNAGAIQQGQLESSNVNIMNEMTNLIRAQRAYEMNSKVMGIADQMLQTTNNIR